MSGNRVSLGFDLRINLTTPTKARVPQAYLDPKLLNPISADPGVWPSSEEVGTRWDGLLPEFLNPLYLASSMEMLIDAYTAAGLSVSDLTPLCITGDPAITIGLNMRFGDGYFEHLPIERDLVELGWQFRGFDVVDLDGLVSGLKDCDYREPMWSRLREVFGKDLNNDGLFYDAAVASHFADARGLEIRQHAPFVVVGILTHTLKSWVPSIQSDKAQ